MITREDFEDLIRGDSALSSPILKAASSVPVRALEKEGALPEEVALAVIFAVTTHIVTQIGLPWQSESRNYADLWRQKFRPWIDQQHQEGGFNPYAVESAGNALRRELESLTDSSSRESWERFAVALRQEKSE